MIKNIGIEMNPDLFTSLKNDGTMIFLSTCSEKGIPNMMPLTIFYPKNKESIIISIVSDSQGYKNMVWQKKVFLSIIESEKNIVHLIGRAGIIRAPSQIHPLMHIAQVDIIDIVEENSLLVQIQSGVRWSHPSNDAKKMYLALKKELLECAKVL